MKLGRTWYKGAIEMQPAAGVHIDDCLKEAIILALEEDCIVTFKHNVILFKIDPNEVRKLVRDKSVKEVELIVPRPMQSGGLH